MNTRLKGGMGRQKRRHKILCCFLGLILFFFVMAPIVWMFFTSVMSAKDLIAHPLSLIPRDIDLFRYKEIFQNTNKSDVAYVFRIALGNSAIIAITVTLLSLVIGSLGAYAFARLRFRGKNGLMLLVLFTYMLPPVALVIPMYKLFNATGMIDSKFGLIILYLSFIIPFIIWVMQGFYGSISKSFEEAAEIDGATRFQTFLYIFVPMARPGAIATGILAFLMSWDEFFYSLIFTSSFASKTITVAIAEFNGKFTIDYGMISAAGVIGSLLPVLITLIFQKYIVIGMTAGGVKE